MQVWCLLAQVVRLYRFVSSIENAYHSSLFDNDFLAISGESFVVSGAILLLVYGVVYSNYQYPASLDSPLWPQLSNPTPLEKTEFADRQDNLTSTTNLSKPGPTNAHKKVEQPRSYNHQEQNTQYRGHPILVNNCGWHTLLILFFA